MRVAYILAAAPFAAQEQFALAEGAEVVRQGDEVIFAPLRPGRGRLTPGSPDACASRTLRGAAWSPGVIAGAARELARGKGARRIIRILRSRADDEPLLQPLARNVYVLAKTLSLAEPLRAAGVTHIHAHFCATTATAGWILSELLGVPWGFTAHSPTDITKRNLLTAKVGSASFVRTISEAGRDLIARRVPEDLRSRPRVVHMGVRAASGRSPAPVASGRPRIACIARLVPGKRHAVLIEALALLRARGLDVECHLLGDGPGREELQGRATAAGVADLVRFRGYVANPVVLRELAEGRIDLAVLPSASEGLPIVLMEALAAGVRVVATDVGGVAELVTPAVGALIRPDDPDALAEAVREQLSRGAATTGPTLVRERFCLSRNVEALRELLRSAS